MVDNPVSGESSIKFSLVQLAIAALAPFLVVVASQMPLTEVVKWITGAIL